MTTFERRLDALEQAFAGRYSKAASIVCPCEEGWRVVYGSPQTTRVFPTQIGALLFIEKRLPHEANIIVLDV